MAQLLDGKIMAAAVMDELKIRVDALKAKGITLKDTPQGVQIIRA